VTSLESGEVLSESYTLGFPKNQKAYPINTSCNSNFTIASLEKHSHVSKLVNLVSKPIDPLKFDLNYCPKCLIIYPLNKQGRFVKAKKL